MVDRSVAGAAFPDFAPRMALGATRRTVVWMVLIRAGVLVAVVSSLAAQVRGT